MLLYPIEVKQLYSLIYWRGANRINKYIIEGIIFGFFIFILRRWIIKILLNKINMYMGVCVDCLPN